MSDDIEVHLRLQIEPEPTDIELVAILMTMQPVESVANDAAPKEPRWTTTARREPLRTELDANWSGWNR